MTNHDSDSAQASSPAEAIAAFGRAYAAKVHNPAFKSERVEELTRAMHDLARALRTTGAAASRAAQAMTRRD